MVGVVLLLPSVAVADIVIFKDGRRIETREPYKHEGDQAVLVLTNGTVTTVPLVSIDAQRTSEANRLGSGSARVVDGTNVRPIQPNQNPSSTTSSLSQVASQRKLAGRRQQPSRADSAPSVYQQQTPLVDNTISNFLTNLYASQGIDSRLFESTGQGTATVLLTTDTEAEVFRSLVTTAVALLQSVDKLEQPIAVIELQMRSSDGGQAGDFRLTYDRAESLRSRTISAQEFYVRYVDF